MLSTATNVTFNSKKNKISATKSSARRCLFGRLDHKVLNESLERELRIIDAQLEEKWQFDFAKEQPLSGGRFAWSPVDCKSEYVPGPYLREYTAKPTRPRTQVTLKRRLNFDDEDTKTDTGCGVDENALPACPELNAASPVNSKAATTASTTRVQPCITAFYQQRKKQRTEKC